MGVRQCNWVRFLRLNLLMDDAVNIIGTKASSGEPLFEVTSTKLVLIHLRLYGWDSGYFRDSRITLSKQALSKSCHCPKSDRCQDFVMGFKKATETNIYKLILDSKIC